MLWQVPEEKFIPMNKTVHIGEQVKQRLYDLRMPVIEFAQKINKSRTVVYHIFRRKSIDAELLKKISETLEYDFFIYYTQYLPDEIKLSKKVEEPEEPAYSEIQKKNYESKIEALTREINYLKEINEMLREKLKDKGE